MNKEKFEASNQKEKFDANNQREKSDASNKERKYWILAIIIPDGLSGELVRKIYKTSVDFLFNIDYSENFDT